jgi:hypothetical protein
MLFADTQKVKDLHRNTLDPGAQADQGMATDAGVGIPDPENWCVISLGLSRIPLFIVSFQASYSK